MNRPRERKNTVRNILVVAGLLAALGAAGCGKAPAAAPREVARNVRVLELSATSLAEYHEISGPVAPVRGADLAAEESGPVTAIRAAKGAPVSAGQVLVEQERTILKAEMDAAASQLKTQDFNLDRVRQLFEAGKVSEFDLLNAESAQAQVASLADISRRRWERAAIKAPFAGIVAERFVELGATVTAGQPVARVIDPYRLKLSAYVTDTDIAWVRVGDAAEVSLGEAGERGVGEVTWVGAEADLRTGKFPVEIEIPNPDLALHSGVIGRARLPRHTVADVVVVPRDAVLASDAGPRVFVVDGDRATLREVTLGEDQGLLVVVREGLRAGEKLVVRGQRELSEGSLVAITETATAPDGTVPGDPAAVRSQGAATRVGEPTAEAAR
ncbi:MAG: efflux RND transporter periplasmic adaptor subunit [bacterium]|nr:efflux RND transporter periplasmic adaptor subunit [bacterium]